MNMEPALVLNGVTIRYEPEAPPVLSDLSFSLAPGEKAALLGLNGSGKTTLLMAVAGLVPFRGKIRVGSEPAGSLKLPRIREKIGLLFNVPEDQLLFPGVLEDVAFSLRHRKITPAVAAARARQALATLQVGHLAAQPVHHLSHGQKQKVALAGALVSSPPLLLLDEPSAGLDPPGKMSLARHLAALPAAILLATHDLPFAARVCTRYLLVGDGRLLQSGDCTAGLAGIWPDALI